MRRDAGVSSVGPASGGGEVAAGSTGARGVDSRARGWGFIAGTPDDDFQPAGFPPAGGGPLEYAASSRSRRRSLCLASRWRDNRRYWERAPGESRSAEEVER